MRPCTYAQSHGLLRIGAPAVLTLALTCALASPLAAQDCGDCDGNSTLNIADALTMARIATGIIMPTSGQRALCDVDASGSVDTLDVLLMARLVAGDPGVTLLCPPQGVPFATGTQPLTVRITDINLDGHLDILVGLDPPGVAGGMVRIHYGQAGPMGSTSIDWSMATIEDVPSPGSSGVSSILTGDINNDGNPDLLTVEFETGSFTFWPGTQACPGTFDSFSASPPQTFSALGPIAWGGTLADIDIDGDLDFITIGAVNGITVYRFVNAIQAFDTVTPRVLRPGFSSLGPCTLVVPFDPIAVAVGDVTENGLPDVIGAYTASSKVVVFKQEMDSLFDTSNSDRPRKTLFSSCDDEEVPPVFREYPTSSPLGVGSFPAAVLTGDLNRDGHLDIVTVGSFHGSVSYLRNNGDGTFQAPIERDFGLGAIALTLNAQLVDLNRDGVLDLVATSEIGDEIFFLAGSQAPGTENFNFQPPRRFPTSLALPGGVPPVPTNPAGLDIGDLDEDGANDIAVATTRTGEFQILDLTAFGGLTPRQFIAFNTAISYEVGADNPIDIAAGSILGGDVFSDVITANGDGTLSLFRGFERVGAGLVFPPFVITLPGASAPTAIAVGDLDGTIDSDVAVADAGTNSVVIYRHNGSISTMSPPFLAPISLALPGGPACTPSDIRIADISGDGRSDIVVSCRLRNSVVVFNNSLATPGTFGPGVEFDTGPAIDPITRVCDPGNFAGCGPARLAIANVDNLNGLDVVTGNNDSYDLTILVNDGLGGLSISGNPAGVPPTATPSQISGLCMADFNGDGFADYAVAHANSGGSFSNVFIFAGNGQGGFAPPGSGTVAGFTTGLGISDIACRDLDADGDPDLVVATSLSGIVSVVRNRLNEATADFEFDPLNCPAGGRPIALAVADVSGDGYVDILTANPPDSVTYVPGRSGGRFLCTLTQTIPGGLIDLSVGRLDDDAQEDLAIVVEGTPNQVVLSYGTGNSGADETTTDDDVFQYEPIVSPEEYTLSSVLGYGGRSILAVSTGDYDIDGDTDIAVLYGDTIADPLYGQLYTGPGVEIFYNTDNEDRGVYNNVISDFHVLFTFEWRPILPLLDEAGALIPPYNLGGARFNHAFDLITEDVNHDGLLDFVALLPRDQASHLDSYLVVTLNPGITGSPDDGTFSPERFIDFQGYIGQLGCGYHGHSNFGTQYGHAISPPNGCLANPQVTQFTFNLGPIDATSVTVTDAYPKDGKMEVVVTDETNGQLLVFEVDHTTVLATAGRADLDAVAALAGLPAVPLGYPPGNVAMTATIGGFSTGVADVTHGDVNNDGRPDLVAGLYANPGMGDRGFLALDQPDCAGAVPGIYGILEMEGRKQCVLVDTDDYNRDGKNDALLVSDLAEVASVFYFDEASTPATMTQLTPRVDHIIGAGDQSDLVKGDFNNDGRLDVIITTDAGSQLTILLGTF